MLECCLVFMFYTLSKQDLRRRFSVLRRHYGETVARYHKILVPFISDNSMLKSHSLASALLIRFEISFAESFVEVTAMC